MRNWLDPFSEGGVSANSLIERKKSLRTVEGGVSLSSVVDCAVSDAGDVKGRVSLINGRMGGGRTGVAARRISRLAGASATSFGGMGGAGGRMGGALLCRETSSSLAGRGTLEKALSSLRATFRPDSSFLEVVGGGAWTAS